MGWGVVGLAGEERGGGGIKCNARNAADKDI